MAIKLQNTRDVAVNGIKCLVYGQAGAGKTSLIKTLPSPVVLSAEAGLLSISDQDIPFVLIETIEQLQEAYLWLKDSEESRQFQSVCLDSISEIAEVVLTREKAVAKDPRQAYGAMQDTISELIRCFRDLPGRNVYFSAKLEKAADETGRMMYAPSMPGNKIGQALPFFFDEVLALRVEQDSAGKPSRALQCHSDGHWQAKDRSGRLEMWEAPDLGAIIRKIGGVA
jgi:phage nucleotide-binding protein